MKILHLSTSDIEGGAARGANRLHAGLKLEGLSSGMFVRSKLTNDDSVLKYRYPAGTGKLRYKYLKSQIMGDLSSYKSTRPTGFELFSDDRSPLKPGMKNQLPVADIYNLHWTSGFIDLPSFFRETKVPVVWTLHDMFPFTGGCHYTSGCEKYRTHCNCCPQLGSKVVKDLSWQVWERKYKALSEFKNRISIRADSFWLAGEAKQSSLFRGMDIDTIHYGVESNEFIPRDKAACRKALNIPVKSKIIVFGAPGLTNPRKGFGQLVTAIGELIKLHPSIFLVSFGSGTLPVNIGIPSLNLGHVSDNNLLSVIYNCADVFVIPSLQEAFGQTALEAMSCGVPVAGFNTGGIPDMIEEGVTGFLAETGNTKELADAISKIISSDNTSYELMSANCRQKVLQGFTLSHQALSYIETYKKLMNQN